MNRVFLVGNLTSDIYYDHIRFGERVRPFLRLILMARRPQLVKGLRVNIWDEKAELYYPYLQCGSRIAVFGNLLSRDFKGSTFQEIEAVNLIMMRNINWEYGEKERIRRQLPRPSESANNAFIIGEVEGEIHLDWYKRANEMGNYALLRFRLSNDQYLNGLRINVLGSLAELVQPYLKKDTKVAIDGHFETRERESGKIVEVTAEHITFLEGVNWGEGKSSQLARLHDPKVEVVK